MGYYRGLLGFVQNQQGLGENQRQFNANFGENARQFDNQFLEGQRQFDSGMVEDSRRFDNTFLEGQRQYDNSFLEGQRQFDTGIGEQARQFNLGYGQDYDRILMDYLGQAFGIDENMFQRNAQAFGLNQGEMQRQFSNNAGLLGLIPQGNNAPINVANAYGISMNSAQTEAARKAQERQQMMQTIGSIAAGLFASGSSREIKDKTGELSGEEALEIVMSLPVDRWKYKGDDREYIGTYAEDFAEATGTGDGKTISFIDYLGVLTAAVQEIARRAA